MAEASEAVLPPRISPGAVSAAVVGLTVEACMRRVAEDNRATAAGIERTFTGSRFSDQLNTG